MPHALAAIATLTTSGVAYCGFAIFALTENVWLAVVTGFFAFATSAVGAVLTYLTRRAQVKEHRAARISRERIERKVDAPRKISTDREEGVRVEGPDETHSPGGQTDAPT